MKNNRTNVFIQQMIYDIVKWLGGMAISLISRRYAMVTWTQLFTLLLVVIAAMDLAVQLRK